MNTRENLAKLQQNPLISAISPQKTFLTSPNPPIRLSYFSYIIYGSYDSYGSSISYLKQQRPRFRARPLL